ncbi:hypothetical protein GWK47_028205 [Chionoecetes opilio]|uniref:Uncharacterized protein n=1 Tax=Chionoecetes opilio TaxID=41210 RepID=A0A8J4YPF0_CHIOP|nr:hypothetical protein GWK47_028205 [Chionoecetes opilio]
MGVGVGQLKTPFPGKEDGDSRAVVPFWGPEARRCWGPTRGEAESVGGGLPGPRRGSHHPSAVLGRELPSGNWARLGVSPGLGRAGWAPFTPRASGPPPGGFYQGPGCRLPGRPPWASTTIWPPQPARDLPGDKPHAAAQIVGCGRPLYNFRWMLTRGSVSPTSWVPPVLGFTCGRGRGPFPGRLPPPPLKGQRQFAFTWSRPPAARVAHHTARVARKNAQSATGFPRGAGLWQRPIDLQCSGDWYGRGQRGWAGRRVRARSLGQVRSSLPPGVGGPPGLGGHLGAWKLQTPPAITPPSPQSPGPPNRRCGRAGTLPHSLDAHPANIGGTRDPVFPLKMLPVSVPAGERGQGPPPLWPPGTSGFATEPLNVPLEHLKPPGGGGGGRARVPRPHFLFHSARDLSNR